MAGGEPADQELREVRCCCRRARAAVPMRTALILVALGVWAACRPSTPHQSSSQNLLQSFASLPSTRSTHDERIRNALALIESEGGLPEQLAERTNPPGPCHWIPWQQAIRLEDAGSLSRRIKGFYPSSEVPWRLDQVQQAREVLYEYGALLEQMRAALSQPTFGFPYDVRLGLLNDLTFLDYAELYILLEGLDSSLAIAQRRWDPVLQNVARSLQLVRRIDRLPSVTCRMHAARLRREVLQVVSAVAGHPAVEPAVQKQLLEMLTEHWQEWPDEVLPWRSERAQGLVVYEMIRQGYLLSLLSWEEIRRLKERNRWQVLLEATGETLDEDQWQYIQWIEAVIQMAGKPFYQQQEKLDSLYQRWNSLPATVVYPIIADTLLVSDVRKELRIQAADQARVVAWTTVLAAATGQPVTDHPVNPVDGRPMVPRAAGDRVVVGPVAVEEGAETMEARLVPAPPHPGQAQSVHPGSRRASRDRAQTSKEP